MMTLRCSNSTCNSLLLKATPFASTRNSFGWGRSHSFCPLEPYVKENPSPRALDFEAPGLIKKKPSIVVSLACTTLGIFFINV